MSFNVFSCYITPVLVSQRSVLNDKYESARFAQGEHWICNLGLAGFIARQGIISPWHLISDICHLSLTADLKDHVGL